MGRLLTWLLAIIGVLALVAVGGYFALKRPDIPYETLAARYENAASRYVDLPSGVRMHYRDEGVRPADGGSAPTILLIHGYSASLHTWEAWVDDLGQDFRVISIDLPGHGLTRAPAGYDVSIGAYRDVVAEFAEAMWLTRFAIAGSSMGGNVAWEYALAHADQLDALILVDAAGWEGEAPRREPAIFPLLRNPITAPIVTEVDVTPLIRRGLESSFADPARVSDAMVSRYAELARAPGHRDMLIALMLERGERDFATAERLAPITLPVLVLHGAQDNLIPPGDAQRFKDALPHAALIVLDASAMAVREFLHQVYEGSALPPPVASAIETGDQ